MHKQDYYSLSLGMAFWIIFQNDTPIAYRFSEAEADNYIKAHR